MPPLHTEAVKCKEYEVKITREKHPVAAAKVVEIGKYPIDQRHDGIAAQAHDHDGAAQLGKPSQPI